MLMFSKLLLKPLPLNRRTTCVLIPNTVSGGLVKQGHPPIPVGYVIPIRKNLQGHPEAPRQWSCHIDSILQEYNFVPTVHAPCLYRAIISNENVLFFRQVDDFAIATNDLLLYTHICDALDSKLLVPMKRQGLLTHYNGIDIIQTSNFITTHCGTYIRKLLQNHAWMDMKPSKLPMPADNNHIKALDTILCPTTEQAEHLALETSYFRYWGAIGELIWAMTTCHPDSAFASVKLSQSNSRPAELHYHGLKHAIRYLYTT